MRIFLKRWAGSIAVGLTIAGIVLNGWRSIYCWPVWILSNLAWADYSLRRKQWPVFLLQIIVTVFDIYGWRQWLR